MLPLVLHITSNTQYILTRRSWSDVYRYLEPYGLAVPGGRIGPVGVPGLLLAGGVNFYGNEVGWAADSVVNYEIVLADGSLTNVNKTHLPDLFWALKGGSSNFGIVTRFDVETIKSPKIWGGTYTVSSQYLGQFLEVRPLSFIFLIWEVRY